MKKGVKTVQFSHPTRNHTDTASCVMKKHLKINETNYHRNRESDYTEKIAELDKQFKYEEQKDIVWGIPEQSLFYGSPLYEQASSSQKLALNHLYWTRQYNQTAATEANTIVFNQITSGLFSQVGGYDTLCQELDLETEQEYHHVHAFHKIGYNTQVALLGKKGFNTTMRRQDATIKLGKFQSDSNWQKWQTKGLRFFTKQVVLRQYANLHSPYLKELEKQEDKLGSHSTGLLGKVGSRAFLKLLTFNCGISPFMGTVFYATRYMANMLLKNFEYRYCQYYRSQEKKGESIASPTAVSYYHLMDESFHTTTSQIIAQYMYKDFSVTPYEKFLANLMIYRAQKAILSGLSGSMPSVFRSDSTFIPYYYALLQTPLFGMTSQEALIWLEKSLCQEHEGFISNLKFHQQLLAEIRRIFDTMDYLWPVNRELKLMEQGGNLEKALQTNKRDLQKFAHNLELNT
jgi:hypothetical protein